MSSQEYNQTKSTTIIQALKSTSHGTERRSRQRARSAEDVASCSVIEATSSTATATTTQHQPRPYDIIRKNINDHAFSNDHFTHSRNNSSNSLSTAFTSITPITPAESRASTPTLIYNSFFVPVEPLIPSSGAGMQHHTFLDRLTPVSPRAVRSRASADDNDNGDGGNVMSPPPPRTPVKVSSIADRLGGNCESSEPLGRGTPDQTSRQRQVSHEKSNVLSPAVSIVTSLSNSCTADSSSNVSGNFDKENAGVFAIHVKRAYSRGLTDHPMLGAGSVLEDIPVDCLEEYDGLQGQFFVVEDDSDDDDIVDIGCCMSSRSESQENSPTKR
ncbi:hypothetical protein SeMB42_g06168 [Synchytrium endobioticum]|uniref:Uncharacterized protein n=1 Tax=Synchytrium endobioticum TaxID=286115 RepID=A0A507D1F7_9FUNG|nr:hypothetical protein SeMB42_g06168 [Synchytrium endobioticum]TPX45293.1 hypothetical protein SeLEV6574_g03961 [Synchytrium endobioticum]